MRKKPLQNNYYSMQKVILLHCWNRCFYETNGELSSNPTKLGRDLPRSINLLFPWFMLQPKSDWHTAFEKQADKLSVIIIICHIILEPSTLSNNSVILERVLFENVRSSYLQNEKLFFAHFLTNVFKVSLLF